jgi:hypothetical protein
MTVILLFAMPLHIMATDSDEKKKSDGTVSILKFIPGLPQLKEGKYLKGTLLLSSFITVVTGSILYNNQGNKSYNAYQKSTDVAEILLLRDETEKSFRKRNFCIVGIFSIFVVHILDLKFFKSKKAGVSGNIGKNTIDIGFYYRF